ncbi:hypothetical protein C1645_751802 [Glomus cerebriforme]|uniref:Extracellular membrane protein CFEM domain-containing protein n=1 Tax=Glomus cerebriforme TaxID=658196 RepID=A0A397TMN5_9GLOM|nr:hypothetical protein C1645_751802 [Glomus cerebriforme]
METKSIVVFLLLLLLSMVRAQDGAQGTPTVEPATTPTSSPNDITTCLELRQCGDNQDCRAKCAGVPNPTEKQVNDTIACIESCTPSKYSVLKNFFKKIFINFFYNKLANPSDTTCRDSCIDTYYNPKPTYTTTAITTNLPTAAASNVTSQSKSMPTPISSSVAVKTVSSIGSFFTLLLAFIVVLISIGYF